MTRTIIPVRNEVRGTPMTRTGRRRGAIATAFLASAALALTGCGSGDDSGDGGDTADVDIDAVLEEGGELTVWAWDPTLETVAENFQEEYPNVDIELVNAGTGNDQYTALQNAIQAGSGVPDVAQVEFYALPQFVLAESLADLSQFGAAGLDGTFTPGPWSAVTQDDGVYALPTDSGPMALFYNKTLFDEHDLEVPTTWEQFAEVGRQLQEEDPDSYITSDTGDAGMATSLIWQAGGQPFQVDGTDVTIDLADEGSSQYGEYWNTLVSEDLLAPITAWSDEWYQGLADGTIATLVTGAWMRGNLESSVPDGSGDWAVAPMPQWEEGANVTAENGGSSLAVPAASDQQELAYAFVEYTTAGDGVAPRIEEGAFPATTADLESEEFTTPEFEYFGGQQVNQVLAESASNVIEGWQYLPYQVYANSIFNDTVGQAYVSDATITEGLAAWQDALVTYGNEQGFSVSAP